MDAVFVALADGTRRRLLEVLAGGPDATATQLSAQFPMTRQAIAKHLQVLADAGLASSQRQGRETHWRLTPEALSPALQWMVALGGDFSDRVGGLQRHLAERAAERQLGIAPRPAPANPLRIAASGRPSRPEPPRRFPFLP